MSDQQGETFEMYRKKFDDATERTIRAAMEKLKGLRDHGDAPKYVMYSDSKDAIRVFRKITKRWLEFWK